MSEGIGVEKDGFFWRLILRLFGTTEEGERDTWEREAVRATSGDQSVQIASEDSFVRALIQIRNVLGPDHFGCPEPCCEGCRAEGAEALRIASEALGFAPRRANPERSRVEDPRVLERISSGFGSTPRGGVTPLRFRKRPVEIDALRYLPGETCAALAEWMDCPHDEHDCYDDAEWLVETLEGPLWAKPGDWIVKGIKGEFYPVKPDIFEATYEAVDNGADEPPARERTQ